MDALNTLDRIAAAAPAGQTDGLPRATVASFLDVDPMLAEAISMAGAVFDRLQAESPALLALPEAELIARLQQNILNFYAADSISPYVPLAARGPWLVTSRGAVIYDAGGYGMLGLGHAPPDIERALSRRYAMANVMTASFCQARTVDRLRQEIGHRRGSCPYDAFVFLNSGSEAMALAARISDVRARFATVEGGPFAGRTVSRLTLQGSFHGRTDRPARFSSSSRPKYLQYLHSFQQGSLVTVPANDIDALRRTFAEADDSGVWFEAFFFEPVQGEGRPGVSVHPDFYAVARELTAARGTLLVADSIQAGLRAHGVLSVVDYPGFEGLPAPDVESYSKALNAGQFPMSALALSAAAAADYRAGLYGNTMTANPRAMAVAGAVLDAVTPELRANIVRQGKRLLAGLQAIDGRLRGHGRGASGTGLLCALELDPDTLPVTGDDNVEAAMRRAGLQVIHGGKNAIRLTPWFGITDAEVDLLLTGIERVLRDRLDA